LVAKDVREGREELNFSTWTAYSMMDKLAKLDDIVEEVNEGEMPMKIYTVMHPSAGLDEAQRQLIVSWAEATMDIVAEEEDLEEE
jgi:flavodoxin